MWYILCSVTVLFLSGLWGHAQNSLNFATLKKDTQVFEKIVDERLKQDFSNPFAITDNPQATYLQGYGVVVSFHLNINRATIRTPWGQIAAPRKLGELSTAREARRVASQLGRVRAIMIQCLADFGSSIKQLGGHDRISISARIEDRNELDPLRRRTVVVVTASKDDVDLLRMNRISADKFKERVHILEY
ncbi:MAG: hypothetical protein ACE5JX_10645 [Acidobacteriota bacterium]